MAKRVTRRGIIMVFSDLFDEPEAVLTGLMHLRHRRHEVIVFHVMDRAEEEFPFQESTLFRGMEQMPELLTDPRSLRDGYLEQVRLFATELEQGCRAQNIDFVRLRRPAARAGGLDVPRASAGAEGRCREKKQGTSLLACAARLAGWECPRRLHLCRSPSRRCSRSCSNPLLAVAAAAGAVAIPVVIHLLNRKRYRIVPWAAMRFLLAAQRKTSRKVRLEQILLLVVRCLVLLLLLLAMCSVTPWAENAWGWFAHVAPGAVPVAGGAAPPTRSSSWTARSAWASRPATRTASTRPGRRPARSSRRATAATASASSSSPTRRA